MWGGGYAADDYQQWPQDRGAFMQYPMPGQTNWGWEDGQWHGESPNAPPSHDLARPEQPYRTGQFGQYDVMEERMSVDKRVGPVQMPSIPGKGAGSMAMPPGKGSVVPKAAEKKRAQETPEGNAVVIVKQLFGPEKKLGLNLRGVKVENFSEPDAGNTGWKKGDVITAVNGTKVTSFEEFNRAFDKAKQQLASKPIQFRVQRMNEAKSEKGHTLWPAPLTRFDMRMDAKSQPFGFRVDVVATDWCISGMEYACTSQAGVALRTEPGLLSARNGLKIEASERFFVSDALMGSDQRMYLKLADDQGWIADDFIEKMSMKTNCSYPRRIISDEHSDEYERLSINLRRLRDTQIARTQADYGSVD